MDPLKLSLVLLLPFSWCFLTEERNPDVTPLCSSAQLPTITLIVCKIRTKANTCSLLYRHGHDFEQNCDSRFTLRSENQTVSLHLSNLTAEDNGTCECSHTRGTDVLHVGAAVEAEGKTSHIIRFVSITWIGTVAAVVSVVGVILGILMRKRAHTQADPPAPPDKEDENSTYTSLLQPACDLYQSVSSMSQQHDDKMAVPV